MRERGEVVGYGLCRRRFYRVSRRVTLVRDRFNGEDVAEYLMGDRFFPRALAHCLKQVEGCFEILPNVETPLRSLIHAQRTLSSEDVKRLLRDGGLYRYIDEFQHELGDIHGSIAGTWFGLEPAQKQG